MVIGGAFGLALLIQAFLFQPFRIPSGSMIPTLDVHDRIVVNKLSYKLHDVHRGDVVVFTTPQCQRPSSPTWANCGIVGEYRDLVKRVIALPGDRLAISGGRVYINGEELDEPYVRKGSTTVGSTSVRLRLSRHACPSVRDPQGNDVRDGRQPQQLVRQSVLRPREGIEDRGPGLPPDLADQSDRVALRTATIRSV